MMRRWVKEGKPTNVRKEPPSVMQIAVTKHNDPSNCACRETLKGENHSLHLARKLNCSRRGRDTVCAVNKTKGAKDFVNLGEGEP